MVTLAPTNDLAKSVSTINPVFQTAAVTATISANSVALEPLRSLECRAPLRISTPYMPARAYNGNIILNWSDISFMKTKIEDSMKRLEEIRELQDNWNGNGASSFSTAIIERAKKLISSLSIQPNIFPTGRDSIQMEYEKENGDYLELELFEDSRLKLFIYTHTGESKTRDILLCCGKQGGLQFL